MRHAHAVATLMRAAPEPPPVSCMHRILYTHRGTAHLIPAWHAYSRLGAANSSISHDGKRKMHGYARIARTAAM